MTNHDEHEILHAINHDPEKTKRRQSLAILYVEHALARKIKYDKIIRDFEDEKSRLSPTV